MNPRHLVRLASAGLVALLSTACGDPPCDTSVLGNICTIAGSGENGYSGDDGPALEARFSLPMDTLTAPDGSIYVIDWNNHRIRKIDSAGTLHHVAGRGELGGTLDDPANSDFNHPTGILLDPTGKRLFVAAWHNSKIRSIDLDTLVISDNGGDGRRAYFGDGGPAVTAALDLPASIAWDPQGNLIIMDQANQVLRRVDAQGNISRIAGKCVIDAPAPAGPGPCATPVACPNSSGKFTCGDPMATCGAPCRPAHGGDEGPAMEMRISQPFGQSADPAGRILFDDKGTLYFADSGNNMIRTIDAQGMVHRIAGLPPEGGMPSAGYSGDGGPALQAKLNHPTDLARGSDGTLYFTDTYNHCVRAIDPSGNVRTVVGACGTKGSSGDGGPAAEARLNRPYGLELSGDTLIVSDTGNNRVRAIKLR